MSDPPEIWQASVQAPLISVDFNTQSHDEDIMRFGAEMSWCLVNGGPGLVQMNLGVPCMWITLQLYAHAVNTDYYKIIKW